MMMIPPIILLLLHLVTLPPLITSCQILPTTTQSGSNLPIAGAICSTVIDYPVYIPPSTCSLELNQKLIAIPALMTTISNQICRIAAVTYMCTETYQRCDITTNSSIVSLPCRSLCEAVNTECASQPPAFWAQIPDVPRDCSLLPTTGCNAGPTHPITVPLPRCEKYLGTACSDVLDATANIYVQAGVSQTQMESVAMSYRAQLFGAAAKLPQCDIELPRFLCHRLFPTCATAPFPIPPIPRFINRTQCDTFTTTCSSLIAAVPALITNCSSQGIIAPGRKMDCNKNIIINGGDDFPINTFTFAGVPVSANTYTYNNGSALPTRSYPVTGTCMNLRTSTMSASGPVQGNICAGILDAPAFIPSTTCASFMETKISSLPTLLAQIPSTTCRTELLKYVCIGTWNRCDPATNRTTTLVSVPCRSMCTSMLDACSDPISSYLLTQIPDLITTCSILPTTSCQSTPTRTPIVPLPTCRIYKGAACSHILGNDTNIYIPAGFTYDMMEAYAAQSIAAVMGTKSTGCDLEYPRFICNRIFPTCHTITTSGITAVFPRFIAKSQCDTFVSKCSQLFQHVPSLRVNCSSQGMIAPGRVTSCSGTIISPGLRDFPDVSTTFTPSLPAVPANDYSTQTRAYVAPNQYGRCEILNQGNRLGDPTRQISPSGGSVCKGVINYPIFIPSTTCQSAMEQPLYQLPSLFASISNMQCRHALASYVCSGKFQQCDNSTGAPPYPVQAPCASLCRTTLSACSDPLSRYLLTTVPGLPLDCTTLPETGCNMGSADAIAPIIPTCTSHTGKGVCSKIIPTGSNIYVPPGLNYRDLELYASKNAYIFAVAPKATGCDLEAQRFICNRIFNPCHTMTNSGITNIFPRFVSYSQCMTYNDKCANFNQANCSSQGKSSGLITTCDGTIISPGLRDFPDSATQFSPSLPLVPANNYRDSNDSLIAISSAATCPYPLVIPDNPDAKTLGGGSCALPCLFVLFRDEEYTTADRLSQAFVTLSFVFGTWMLLTWTLFSTKRKQRLVWVFVFDQWCFTLMMLVHVAQKPKHGHIAELGCRNNSELKDWSDGGWITFLAIWFIFWESKALWWWMLQALDIFLKVVIGFRPVAGSRRERQRDICYTVGGLVYAITFTVIGLITHTYGASDGGVAWAQYHERDPKYPRIPWATIYAPMIVLTAIGSVCMTMTIVSLWRSSMKSGLHSRQRTLRQYSRPIAFVVIFLFFFLFIVIYRAYNQVHESEWKEIVTEWVTCMLGPGGSSDKCGIVPPTSASAGMFYLIHVAIFGQTFLIFLMFGTSMINVKLWAYAVGSTFGITRLLRYGLDATDGASNTSRTGGTEKDGKSGKSKTIKEPISQPASPRQGCPSVPAAGRTPRGVQSGCGSGVRSPDKTIPSSYTRGIGTPISSGLMNQLKDDMASLNPSSSTSQLPRPHHRMSSMGIGVSLGEVGVELGILSTGPTTITHSGSTSTGVGTGVSTRKMSVQVTHGIMEPVLPTSATGASGVSSISLSGSSVMVTPASALGQGMNVPQEETMPDTARSLGSHSHLSSFSATSSGGNRTSRTWV